MKKVLLIGAIALFGAMNAQTFGLKAGMNVSSVSESNTKSKVGFYGGVLMNAPIATNFSIQPEILYSGKGAKSDEGDFSLNRLYFYSSNVSIQCCSSVLFRSWTGIQLFD